MALRFLKRASLVRDILSTLRRVCPMFESAFSSSTDDEVLFSQINSTGLITLNRPKALNSLNLSMVRKIFPQLLKWERSGSSVRQVLIHGGEGKAFCAGGDIVAVAKSATEGTPLHQQFFHEEYWLNHKIGTYKLPYVAIIDGLTMGGGVGLSIHGSHIVATDRTMVAMPETAIGLFADVGSTYPLSRLPGHLGAFLTLTGYRLRGRDVLHAGVATHFVHANLVQELMTSLTDLPSPSVDTVTEVLDKYHTKSLDSSHQFSLQPHLRKIDEIFSRNRIEDIMAALKGENSEWFRNHYENLLTMSPMSMKITLRCMIEASRVPCLTDVLRMDKRLSRRCLEDNDFVEGVRAKLIEKDNNPTWKPRRVEEVTDEMVDHYFSPLPADHEWKPKQDDHSP